MKEKQIEDMAKHCAHLSGGKCQGESECDLMCSMFGTFSRLADAGYRKQTDGEWIITYHLSHKKSPRGRQIKTRICTCDVCGKSNGRQKSNFCPNCGAKMKGGK